VVVVVVVSTVVVKLVGRTGGSGVPLDCKDVDKAGQLADPHARSVGQQPPPRLAGHDRKPVEHVRESVAEDVIVLVIVMVETSGGGGVTLEMDVDVGDVDDLELVVGEEGCDGVTVV
jgi:hypothetical protein